MVTPTQCSLMGGGVTVEEGPHVVDALLVGLYLNDQENLVCKICRDLVHGECHIVDIKDSNFRALGRKINKIQWW